MSQKEQAVLVFLIDHVLYDKYVYIPRRTADIRTKLHEGPHSLQETSPSTGDWIDNGLFCIIIGDSYSSFIFY